MASEFSLIETYFKPLSSIPTILSNSDIQIGIGDDGAVLTPLPNHQLVVVTDTSIEDIHFPKQTPPFSIAWKSLAVNLSDLAAMGANPAFYSLALSLPENLNNDAWLSEFARGLKTLADQYQLPLIGGDTTRSSVLSITITANGWVESNQAILRSGAKEGDAIFVSSSVGGGLGMGGLGLQSIFKSLPASFTLNQPEKYHQKLNEPQPRIELGLALKGIANSAIDISDGLLADIKHILQSSGLSAELNYADIPLTKEVLDYSQAAEQSLFPIICGDDYELCFTVPAEKMPQVVQLEKSLNLKLAHIGKVLSGASNSIKINGLDNEKNLQEEGFKHF